MDLKRFRAFSLQGLLALATQPHVFSFFCALGLPLVTPCFISHEVLNWGKILRNVNFNKVCMKGSK